MFIIIWTCCHRHQCWTISLFFVFLVVERKRNHKRQLLSLLISTFSLVSCYHINFVLLFFINDVSVLYISTFMSHWVQCKVSYSVCTLVFVEGFKTFFLLFTILITLVSTTQPILFPFFNLFFYSRGYKNQCHLFVSHNLELTARNRLARIKVVRKKVL